MYTVYICTLCLRAHNSFVSITCRRGDNAYKQRVVLCVLCGDLVVSAVPSLRRVCTYTLLWVIVYGDIHRVYIAMYSMMYSVCLHYTLYSVRCTLYTIPRTLRVILNMLLVIDSLTAFGSSKYEYREYTTFMRSTLATAPSVYYILLRTHIRIHIRMRYRCRRVTIQPPA